MRDIARLDEVALLALGMDKPTARAFRMMLEKVGAVIGAPTLPETVVETQLNAANVADLEADRGDNSGRDNTLARALADIAAELVRENIGQAAILRRLDDMAADMESLTLANQTLSRRVAELENGVN